MTRSHKLGTLVLWGGFYTALVIGAFADRPDLLIIATGLYLVIRVRHLEVKVDALLTSALLEVEAKLTRASGEAADIGERIVANNERIERAVQEAARRSAELRRQYGVVDGGGEGQ